ncbi:MAG: EAL domain-containing protein [Alphaproteobacteria bacterium]|nr:MAG: EAL domain-containing protein [Alphaproteobacteria bacterium]
MPRVSNMLIFLAYAILSVAAALGASEVWALDQNLSVVAGALTFLVGMQIHSVIIRVQDHAALEDEVVTLQRGNLTLAHELEILRQELTQKDSELEEALVKRSQRIVAEVRVLESLMKQLTDGLERKARMAALEAVEEAERANQSGDAGAISKLINSIENSLSDLEPGQAREMRDTVLDALSEEELLEVIRTALNENLVDLYLQPIVGIPERDVAFYEALTRLRSQSGEMILPAQYLHIAGQAGLMSVIDNLLLFRCVQLVRRIAEQKASISIVCNISLSSVQDQDFFPHFLDFMENNADLCRNLIFEFTQNAFESFGAVERDYINRLSEMGFRMSLDGITHLDLDLPDLRKCNFRFLKIKSDLLVNTLNAPGGEAHLAEFQALAGQYTLELVVERIEEQKVLDRIQSLKIGLGQGFMFGEPRPMEEVEARIQSENAPATLLAGGADVDPDQPKLTYHRK